MTITGHYDDDTGGAVVTVDGEPLSPVASQRVWNHSPSGFAWGYGGSGPAQLALAILLAAGLPRERAVQYHQAFKWACIATLPEGIPFSLELNIPDWIRGEDAGVREELKN
jgi:hypothetical protein